MASNSSIYERNFRRTLSAGESLDGDVDQETTDRRQRPTSEHIRDYLSIEEIVTCCIHLGIMENPRKLTCQHSFCNDCLILLVKHTGTLVCPVCRKYEPCSDVDNLPYALIERQLIEVVMQKRITECTNTSRNEGSLSKEDKEELVKHLMEELKQTNSGLFKFDKIEENDINPDDNFIDPNLAMQTSATSSSYDVMDIETIRENMRKQSCYEEVKHSFRKFGKIHSFNKHFKTQPDFTTFDIHILNGQPESYVIVFADSNTNKVCVYSDTEFRSFYINLDGILFKPAYIRILNDDIFVTGAITDRGKTFSLLLQCNMYGKIIRKSDRCQNSQPELTFPILCGFDVDQKNEKYFVCTPHSNSIRVYNTSLVDSRQYYEFDANKPEFVTFYYHQNQIWVSCPEDRRILIADIDTAAFMMFRTDQINDAIPKMIFCTDNERIVFLDSRSNRFIWIKRRGDYILTQKLHFRSINEEFTIKTFQVLPCSQIVFGTTSEFLVFQPVKMKSKLKAGLTSCALL